MAALTEYQRDILIRTALGEAVGEGEDGMADVVHVILNRANSGKFSSDPAKVALQNKQFSTWNSGAGGNNPQKWSTGSTAYKKAAAVVDAVASGSKPDQTGGSIYYHAKSVTPSWAKAVNTKGAIQRGNHVFYPTTDAPAVGTQLAVRQSPTPAKPSAAVTVARNRQNLTPAADANNSTRTNAASFLGKDGRAVHTPVDMLLGKEMTTRLPQRPGQSVIERAPVRVADPKASASDKARATVAPRAAAAKPSNVATAKAEQSAARGAGNPARPVATPPSNGVASGSIASARSEQAAARAKPQTAVEAITAQSRIPGPNAAPKTAERLTTPALAFTTPSVALPSKTQLEAATGFRAPGIAGAAPAVMSAAMIAARQPKKVAPVPMVRTAAPVVVARKPVVVTPSAGRVAAAAAAPSVSGGGGGGGGGGSSGPSTFLGTATGRQYVSGQSYVTGDGRMLTANNDGSFTNNSTGQKSTGSSKGKK